MLKKLSEKLGFTQTEIKVTLLLVIILAIGFSYKTFFRDKGLASYKNFDYSKEDSTFLSSGNDNNEDVLELNKKNSDRFPNKIIAAPNSINLNTAGTSDLITIPDIGQKTAERIIKMRTRLGGFKSLNELLKVRNISTKKLAKIKKYTYIE